MDLLRRRDLHIATAVLSTAGALVRLPVTREAMVVAALAAVLAPGIGLYLHRPGWRLPWLAMWLMLTLWAIGMLVVAVDPSAGAVAGALTQAGAGVATAVVTAIFVRGRRLTREPLRRLSRREALGRRAL
ncbi:hypothetical protein [Geodermatophilus sp. FMUSA9-8]|uniref:hypothetical protein n=1 Tax=Geodermatophilus sp. FMUSA9-8 TaxID=3120155 RepID=UPI003009AC29